MARQSISFTKPNDEWLKSQIESEEYSSKSELVNDLIRQARKQQAQVDWIRTKLDKAEKSGFTATSKEQFLSELPEAVVQLLRIAEAEPEKNLVKHTSARDILK